MDSRQSRIESSIEKVVINTKSKGSNELNASFGKVKNKNINWNKKFNIQKAPKD